MPSLTNSLDCDFGGGGIPVCLKFRRLYFFCSPDSCNYRLVKCLSESTAKKTPLNQRIRWITVCHFLSATHMKMQTPLSLHNCFHKLKPHIKSSPHHQAVWGEIIKTKPVFLQRTVKDVAQYMLYQALDPNELTKP